MICIIITYFLLSIFYPGQCQKYKLTKLMWYLWFPCGWINHGSVWCFNFLWIFPALFQCTTQLYWPYPSTWILFPQFKELETAFCHALWHRCRIKKGVKNGHDTERNATILCRIVLFTTPVWKSPSCNYPRKQPSSSSSSCPLVNIHWRYIQWHSLGFVETLALDVFAYIVRYIRLCESFSNNMKWPFSLTLPKFYQKYS